MTTTGSTWASPSPWPGRRFRSRTCSWRSAAVSRICCSPAAAYFSLQKPELRALARLIEEARALQDAPGDGLKISRFQAGFWAELTELGIVGRQARRWQQQVSGLLSAQARTAAELPRTLNAELRPYQRDGFGWLAFLWRHQLGGILADDMGLGKTLQALALICQARETDPDLPPFLIVAPTSVVSNWAAEAARFAPDLPVVAITGTARPPPPVPRGDRRGRRRGGHLLHPAAHGLRRVLGADLGRADPGRGPERQEPPVQDLPVRPAAGRPGQDRHHRDADGEQPDGAVVAAVDHRAGPVPRSGPVPRVLREADRARRPGRPARPAAAPDQAAGPAAHQGAGRRGPARQAGTGAGGGAASAAPQAVPDPPAAGAAEGAQPDR